MVAVLLHYFFLATFMWMLMEGVVLYVILVKVFIAGFEKRYMFLFTVISYGKLNYFPSYLWKVTCESVVSCNDHPLSMHA